MAWTAVLSALFWVWQSSTSRFVGHLLEARPCGLSPLKTSRLAYHTSCSLLPKQSPCSPYSVEPDVSMNIIQSAFPPGQGIWKRIFLKQIIWNVWWLLGAQAELRWSSRPHGCTITLSLLSPVAGAKARTKETYEPGSHLGDSWSPAVSLSLSSSPAKMQP